MLLRCLPRGGWMLLCGAAGAQSFNVDVGDAASLPSASYGAAALSPGSWNWQLTLDRFDIQDVHGTTTAVDLYLGFGCPGTFSCDLPSTTGDDGRLMDDGHLCGQVNGFFDQLANGRYLVYTYVLVACGTAPPQRVNVPGSVEGDQILSGTWPGAFVLGGNYARHTVTVASGSIAVNVTSTGVGDGHVNGFQLVRIDDPTLPGIPQCFGDGSGAACPCGNSGQAGNGCQNSTGTGGAHLYTTGATSPDTVVLQCFGELPSALTIFLQGNATLPPAAFGDGLRCAGGILKRLYVKSASGGVAAAPAQGDPSITARSAALGDPIQAGERRYYQTYYRDSNPSYCPAPQGNTFNASHVVKIVW